MGRRTREEAEALREQIIDETLRQFADRGAAATSMGDLAKAVGLSKQGVMHYFPTKQHLHDAIRDRLKEVLDEALPSMVAAFTAHDAELDSVLEEFITLMERHRNLSRYLLRKVAFSDDEVEFSRSGEAIGSLLVDYIRRGQEEGALRQDFDPESALFHLGLLLLMGTATGGKRSATTSPEVSAEQLRLRRHRELVRITRAALLPPGTDVTTLKGRKPTV